MFTYIFECRLVYCAITRSPSGNLCDESSHVISDATCTFYECWAVFNPLSWVYFVTSHPSSWDFWTQERDNEAEVIVFAGEGSKYYISIFFSFRVVRFKNYQQQWACATRDETAKQASSTFLQSQAKGWSRKRQGSRMSIAKRRRTYFSNSRYARQSDEAMILNCANSLAVCSVGMI